jgi:hypothetical protein
MKNQDEKALKLIKYYEKLKADRATWESHWREIAEYIIPNKDAITGQKAAGEKKFSDLFDGTAVHSNELLASALHGMLTNPTTPWFGLTTGVPQLDQDDDVKKWLQDCVRVMHNIMNNSNFQTEIHEVYLDIGSFGTGALLIEEDDVDVLRFLSIPIYQMYIDENYKGMVSTVARCFKKPVKDIVDEFGEEIFEEHKLGDLLKDPHKEFEVLHVIGENTKYNPHVIEVGNNKFYSEYILKEKKITLSSKGFNTWPMPVPRWTKISGEKYGRSPGMKSLPDIKMINQMMKVTLRSAQKVVDPPLQAPDDGIMGPIRTTPGAISYYRAGSQDRIEPLNTGARIDFGFQIMEDVRTRIRSAFFIDQLQLREGPQMTATEVQQRTEEQLRLLGPILGRQHNELLKPMVDRVFEICLKRGQFDKMPDKLSGLKKIDVQYSSMIARAQKTAELESFNRMIGLLGPMVQLDPTITDNIDADKTYQYISEKLGLPYEISRNKIDLKKLRDSRAEAAQKAQAQQDEAHQTEVMSKQAPVIQGMNGSQAGKQTA